MRRSLLAIAAALGFVIAAAALILTSWAVINLVGPVFLPSQGGHSMTATDFASVAVAGATLILAAATVLLAVITFTTLEQGREERRLAAESQTIAAIMPIYERWRSDEFSKIRKQLTSRDLDLMAIDKTEQGNVFRAYLGYLELISILVQTGRVQFEVADKVWPTAFKDAFEAAKPYIDMRRAEKVGAGPLYAVFLQKFVEDQQVRGIAREHKRESS